MSTIVIVEMIFGGFISLMLGILLFTYKDKITALRAQNKEIESRFDALTVRVTILEVSAITDKELRSILAEYISPMHDNIQTILADITNIKVKMGGLPNRRIDSQ